MLLPHLGEERRLQTSSASCKALRGMHIFRPITSLLLIVDLEERTRPSLGWSELIGIGPLNYQKSRPTQCFLNFGKTGVLMSFCNRLASLYSWSNRDFLSNREMS